MSSPQPYSHRNGENVAPDIKGYYWLMIKGSEKGVVKWCDGKWDNQFPAAIFSIYGPIPQPQHTER